MSEEKINREIGENMNEPDKAEPDEPIEDNERREVVSQESCPFCGEVFTNLDAQGCCVEDFDRCEDFIGEGDDGDIYFKRGFNIFDKIRSLCEEIDGDRDVHAYIYKLTGVELTADLLFTDLLELFPEVNVSTHLWDGGMAGCSGYYSYITVDRKYQPALMKGLIKIQEQLEDYERAGSIVEEIEKMLE